jgi:hypothetical protein
MLNLRPVRLRWRESVSLHRFQNRNLLKLDHFRWHGVEDQPESNQIIEPVHTGLVGWRYPKYLRLELPEFDCEITPRGLKLIFYTMPAEVVQFQ